MLRILTQKDTDAFIKRRMEGLRESPFAFGASFEEGVDRDRVFNNLRNGSDENFILGYFDDEALCGIVGFFRESKLKKKHIGWIWGMYVRPDSRGRGIAKSLMLEVINKAKQIEGLSKINLSVTRPQEKALMFYQKLGFVEYAIEKDALRVNGQKVDEIFMSMQI